MNNNIFVGIALLNKQMKILGSCCGSVGRAVVSDTRCPRFDSSHRQNLYQTFVFLFTVYFIEKTKINKKRPEWPTFKKMKISPCVKAICPR